MMDLSILDCKELFSPSNIGITNYEDLVVIKAPDGCYYGFLTDYSRSRYNRVMFVKSTNYDFNPILDFGVAYPKEKRRFQHIEYDPATRKFYAIMACSEKVFTREITHPVALNLRNWRTITSVETTQERFPRGWNNEVDLITIGSKGRWDEQEISGAGILGFEGIRYLIYHGCTDEGRKKIGLAYGKTLRERMTKCPNNPVYTPIHPNLYSCDVRGTLQWDSQGLIAVEGAFPGQPESWKIFFLHALIQRRGITITELPNIIDSKSLGESTQRGVANPYWLIDDEQYRDNHFTLYVNMRDREGWRRLFRLIYKVGVSQGMAKE